MGLLRRFRTFGLRIKPTRSPTAAFVWLAIWIAILRYGDPSASFIMYSVPFGIALIALGPLELLPEQWPRLNFLVNALASGFFFVSIMFAGVALSYEMPLENGGRTTFCLGFWALQLFILHKAEPWIKQSPFRRLGEYRMAYSPPEASQRAERD